MKMKLWAKVLFMAIAYIVGSIWNIFMPQDGLVTYVMFVVLIVINDIEKGNK